MNELRVGMVGHAFMGAAHSQAWRAVNRFFDLPLRAHMTALCGRDANRAAAAAEKLGWASYETDWRVLVERDDIDLVDICTPGDTHAEIAIAALRNGKHVLCEKPLANTVAEAEAMAEAAASAPGVRSMCGYTYRRVPAVALLARLVAEGRVGRVHHVRAAYLQDWLVDPATPMSWRLSAERAGLGALGDIGSHIVDIVQHLTGERITGVSGLTETLVPERPTVDGGTGQVTVDDAAIFLARLTGGALATFEATRFATGRKNALRVEINGSAGSLAFDLERLNELEYYDASRPSGENGFTRILVTEPDHPYLAAWWPPGHLLGYEHGFTHQARDLIEAIATGVQPRPSFADALDVQLVLDAVARSHGEWIPIPERRP
ncbi:Gfo/Idh/MocA family protein [Streptomyces sp. NPDC101776]|uniref:Gfo/Idh/MocA family protein n=1 Tax=Streptomyces sp. NPDC101776 TaxID=3366146 RepID=UPI00381C265E